MEGSPSLLTIALGNSGGFAVVLWNCSDGIKINNYHFLWDEGADPQGQRVPSAAPEKVEPTKVTTLSTTDCRARFEAILNQDISSSTCDVVLSGVVPSKLALLEEMLQPLWKGRGVIWRFHKLRDEGVIACPLVIQPQPSQNVGEDRLAACVGALSLAPTASWIVIDSGTALTVNVVSPLTRPGEASSPSVIGTFEGGLILPGERLMLKSLWAGTAQLPELEHWPLPLSGVAVAGSDEEQDGDDQRRQEAPSNDIPPLIGKSTQEAIRAGVRWMHTMGATSIALSQAELLSKREGPTKEIRCILTGGGAAALWPFFKEKMQPYQPAADPLLVHRGLFVAWLLHQGLTVPAAQVG